MKTLIPTKQNSFKTNKGRSIGAMALAAVFACAFALPVLLMDTEASAQVRTMSDRNNTKKKASPSKTTTKKKTISTPKKTTKKKTTRKRTERARGVSKTRVQKKRDNMFTDLSLGFVGAGASTDTAVRAGFGMRQGNLGFSGSLLGVFAGETDPNNPGVNQGMQLGGVAIDGRYYYPINTRLEPYGALGLGYHSLGNIEQAFRPTIDLGLGVEYRISKEISVGGRYTYNGYWIDSNVNADGNIIGPDGAWSTMGAVTINF